MLKILFNICGIHPCGRLWLQCTHCLNMLSVFLCFMFDGRLDCFSFLTFADDATMNLLVMFLGAHISIGHTPRDELASEAV